MAEMDFGPAGSTSGAARWSLPEGATRNYVRFAAIGDRASRHRWARTGAGWPRVLASLLAEVHDISWCDASTAAATAYDVRRVQLRTAVAHRPHLVALDVGVGSLGRRDWDVTEIRDHLTHCARVLSQKGAVLLTAGVGPRARRHGFRAEQLDAVYGELARRFGTVHLDHASSPAALADQFADALGVRGLVLSRPLHPGSEAESGGQTLGVDGR